MPVENGNELIGGFWRRFWAYIIDAYAVIGLLMPLAYIELTGHGGISFLAILTSLAGVVYLIFTHYKYGRSVGKIILGLKVQTLQKTPLSLRHAISRYAVDAMLSAVSILLPMFSTFLGEFPPKSFAVDIALGWIWLTINSIPLLFNDRKRSLRDFLGSSYVIRTTINPQYPKKRIFFLLLMAALGMEFSHLSLTGDRNILLLSLSLAIYLLLLYLLTRYTKAAVHEEKPSDLVHPA